MLLEMVFNGLAPEIDLLKLSKNHSKANLFISLNPRGTVPVSECESVVLRDSVATLAWLDRKYPDAPLFWAAEARSCSGPAKRDGVLAVSASNISRFSDAGLPTFTARAKSQAALSHVLRESGAPLAEKLVSITTRNSRPKAVSSQLAG